MHLMPPVAIDALNPESPDRRESGGFLLTTDELGDAAILTIDLGVFEKAAIFKAAYWVTDKVYLYFLPATECNGSQSLKIEVRPKVSGKTTAEQLAREFANSLIDFQTRQIVLRETSGARDILLHRAFGEGHKHLNPETLD
jgi:His-Xaa-Ser system protein HxsD